MGTGTQGHLGWTAFCIGQNVINWISLILHMWTDMGRYDMSNMLKSYEMSNSERIQDIIWYQSSMFRPDDIGKCCVHPNLDRSTQILCRFEPFCSHFSAEVYTGQHIWWEQFSSNLNTSQLTSASGLFTGDEPSRGRLAKRARRAFTYLMNGVEITWLSRVPTRPFMIVFVSSEGHSFRLYSFFK
jgi:hypothetical protein